MALHDLINGEIGVNFAKSVAKCLPEKEGFRLAYFIARIISQRKNSSMVHCARANQWVISGKQLSGEELDQRVRDVFDHTAYCLFDLYHNIDEPKTLLEKMTMSPKLEETLSSRENCGEGTIYLTPHLSNFDLAGRAITYSGHHLLVLSYPNPNKGYQMQNKLRKEYAIEVMPMSVESLRLGKQRLQEGKAIITGLDRPLEASKYHPKFFGYPSMLPVTYVKLALQTRSTIVVVACIGNEDGRYTAEASDLIYMDKYDDPVEEMERNAEKVLKQAETFILAHPEQWSMFYPVWPWALDEMPQ
ncbi:MAG: lysophospholipid acyltransferase family protein [Anaerolineaceae bacterium]